MRKWKNIDTVKIEPIKEKPEYIHCRQCGSDEMALIYLTPVTIRPVHYDYNNSEMVNIPGMKINPKLGNRWAEGTYSLMCASCGELQAGDDTLDDLMYHLDLENA